METVEKQLEDIRITLKKQDDTFHDHTINDDVRLKTIHDVQDTFSVRQEEMHQKMEGLATKEDIADLKQFVGAARLGGIAVRFTFNNAAKIGSFLFLILAVGIFIKYGFLAVFAWFITPK